MKKAAEPSRAAKRSNRKPRPSEPGSPFWHRLFDPVDIAPLIYFRIIFGGIMLWECWRYYSAGWIDRYWIDKPFHFTYYGFGWVKPWPGDGMYYHFLVMAILSVCIIVGYRYRLAASLFFLAFTQMFLLDQANYLNHFYMVCLVSFLIVFLPLNRAFSIDSARKPDIRGDTAPAWTLWSLRAQLGLVYFFGGVAKINGDWLQGEPMRMWLGNRTNFPFLGQFFTEEWMVYGMTYGGMLLDLFIAPLLLWRPTRFCALAIGILFHLTNAQLFSIGIFPWFMIFATLIFLPAHWFRVRWPVYEEHCRRRDEQRLEAAGPKGPSLPENIWERLGALSPSRPVVAGLLGVYFTIQVLLPLRHHLYPGNVSWTEEGHLFSWHMKLRTKSARIRFIVTDPASGRTGQFDHEEVLTSRQRRKMSTRPDMILQFAHFIREELHGQGYDDVEVRVRCDASLNGRERQALIDPEVNLAAVERTIWPPATWIVPLTQPLVIDEELQDPRSLEVSDD